MLTKLTINGYALIDSLEVEFAPGFSVITGETGAGKSIILGALQLLLGARADTRAIKPGARQCRIEAEFDDTIITRIITPAGKSRCFIDDVPATVAELKETGSRLIDIHSQHQNLLLQTSDFQLSVVDTLAHNHAEREAYAAAHTSWTDTRAWLTQLREDAVRQEQERDFMQFQLDQLLDAHIVDGEEQTLESEVQSLSHASETSDLLHQADSLMSNDEHGALAALHSAVQRITQAASLDASLAPLADRASSAYIDIKDLTNELSDAADGIVYDPERLAQAEQRLDIINTLMHKHHVTDTHALLDIQASLDSRLSDMANTQSEIEECERLLTQQHTTLLDYAVRLSDTRHAVLPTIIDGLHGTLTSLGMPHASIRIDITPSETPRPDGMDSVQFTMSANQGSPYNPLASLSGGEAARVMLALKSLLTGAVHLPTIIFDEIDTGVSGRIAEAMGHIMHDMGQADRQVISITHLPQIAARGTAHYRVYKQDTETGTETHIERLDDEARVREIATMLSGENMTEAAIHNAQALLHNQ